MLTKNTLHILLLSFSVITTTSYLQAQSDRIWATYYGGPKFDTEGHLVTDASGNVYMAGTTNSTSGISSNGLQNTLGGLEDSYLVKFDAAGNRLWATYYGGTGHELTTGIAVDASGNIYLAGTTTSTANIASNDGFQTTYAGGFGDIFLAKFDPDGNRLWATYYGGSDFEPGYYGGVATDAAGNVYLAGQTRSTSNISTIGSFQPDFAGNYDAFLVKFDGTGSRLWATYFGGPGSDHPSTLSSLAVDLDGHVYMAGNTGSTSGIAYNGFQNGFGGGGPLGDAMLIKFSPSGNRIWSTYYGGSGSDFGYGVATDKSGNVYLTGGTSSKDSISTANGFQPAYGGGSFDGYLAKFNSAGQRLWATYYGGSDGDGSHAVATDASGNVYMAGDGLSLDGISHNGFQNTLAGIDNLFLASFDTDGNRICATYFGNSTESNAHITIDQSTNDVYLSGTTKSINGIAYSGFQNTYGGGSIDGCLVRFTPCITTSVTDKNPNNAIFIYPNPSSDFIQVNHQTQAIDFSYEIINSLGEVVYKQRSANKEQIDISKLMNGIYLLKINDRGLIQSKTFVKD